jgi:hypothetical protein
VSDPVSYLVTKLKIRKNYMHPMLEEALGFAMSQKDQASSEEGKIARVDRVHLQRAWPIIP